MTSITTREAINRVLASELARDRQTVYLGETIRDAGATGASTGLFARFGPNQVIETPVSENAIFGAALGLALSGFRPIVEIYSADFALAVANELMNDIPKWRQQHARSGGLPITVRGWMGSTLGLGPEHSQCMEAFFHHAPGLRVICPGTTRDMAGLLRAAICANEPTIVFEHRRVYELTGDVSEDPDFTIGIGKADVVRSGRDVTLVAWAWMRHLALEAAEILANEAISVEVIDPRTIKPMDFQCIVASVERTGTLVVAEEAPMTGNVGAEIIARTMELAARPFRAARAAMPDRIHPYSARMEIDILPNAAAIARTVRATTHRGPAYPPIDRPSRQSHSRDAA